MAKLIKNRHCVVCGQNNVQMWTLDNMYNVAVMYLCLEHAAPLKGLMEIAGDLAPDEQVPVPERDDQPPLNFYTRGRRTVEMEPLLNWTPPD